MKSGESVLLKSHMLLEMRYKFISSFLATKTKMVNPLRHNDTFIIFF